MTKASRKYYKDIKVLIPIRGSYERNLLRNTKLRIIKLDSSYDAITYEYLVETLGNPSELINDYYTNVDITYLTKRLRISKTIRTCVYILFIFIMLTLAANIGTRLWLYGQSNNSVITNNTTVYY